MQQIGELPCKIFFLISADCLHDFIVGTSMDDLFAAAPYFVSYNQTGNYDICGSYNGTVPAGTKVQIPCVPVQRQALYVTIIGREPAVGNRSLSICEVEVYQGNELCAIASRLTRFRDKLTNLLP